MYCISPEFLKFKIEDTLKALDMECIDLVLLDDPVFNYLDEYEVWQYC
jgi:aryl-alcohol dehydrogenase-like predicted oxidoreductase